MAAGVPVVTTAVAGIPSLIDHGRNGLLVDAPSADAVAGAILRTVSDGDLRRRLIRGGLDTARAHTLDRQAAWMMEQVKVRLSVPVRPVSPDRMTVSIPIAGMNVSGGVKTLVLLANAMADRGWAVRVLLPAYASEGPFALSPRVERLVLWTPSNPWFRVPSALRATRPPRARAARISPAEFLSHVLLCRAVAPDQPACARRYFVQGDEAESHGRLADAGRA